MRDLASRKVSWLAILACALTIWAWARPTQGIRHDAILYMAQVLLHAWPESFTKDIFFAYGSQDSYSGYSWLMTHALRAGAMDFLPNLILWAAHGALLVGIYLLLGSTGIPQIVRAAGLVSVAALSHLYGGQDLIAFGEEFLTARTLAEPLVLGALVSFVRTEKMWWVVWLLAASVFHPLIALPGWLVVWVCLCMRNRQWLLALLILPILVALGLAKIAPFDQLVLQYDDAWWASVAQFVFMPRMATWHSSSWATIFFDMATAWVCSRQLTGKFSTLLRASIIVALGTLALSFLVGDLARNVLVFSIQSWRSLWILHLLVLAILPWLMWQSWLKGAHGVLMALALLLASVNLSSSDGWMFLVWLGLIMGLYCASVELRPPFLRALTFTTVFVLIFSAVRMAWKIWRQANLGDRYDHLTLLNYVLQVPLVAWALGMGILVLLSMPKLVWRCWGAVLVMIGLVVGLANWNQSNPWDLHLDRSMYETHPFQSFIAPQQQVYWDHEVRGAWFMLRRPSYFSVNQGGGVLFNRQTALEFQKRSEIFAFLENQRMSCSMLQVLNGSKEQAYQEDCYPTREIVEQICQTEPALDFMVFGRDLGAGKVAEWSPPPELNAPHKTYRLYACSSFRPSHSHAQ